MGVGKPRGQLSDDGHGLGFAQASLGQVADECVQGLAFQQVHGHEHGAGIRVPVEAEHGGDVGVGQALLLGGLSLQGDEGVRMLFEVLLQQLDGDERIAVLGFLLEEILAFPHGPHAALAEFRYQLEAAAQAIPLTELR